MTTTFQAVGEIIMISKTAGTFPCHTCFHRCSKLHSKLRRTIGVSDWSGSEASQLTARQHLAVSRRTPDRAYFPHVWSLSSLAFQKLIMATKNNVLNLRLALCLPLPIFLARKYSEVFQRVGCTIKAILQGHFLHKHFTNEEFWLQRKSSFRLIPMSYK